MEEADVAAEKEDEYINGGTSSEDDTEVPTQKKKKTAEVVLTPEQEPGPALAEKKFEPMLEQFYKILSHFWDIYIWAIKNSW